MKFSALVASLLATAAVALPAEHPTTIAKRQAQVACTVGYCTQNGGTTGGAGGQTVTVTTVDELVNAAKRTEPLVIVVSGKLTGNTRVRPTSNKTIIGAAGSCEVP